MVDSADVDIPINNYETKEVFPYASRVGLQAAGVGIFASTVQNALSSHSRGAMGFVTRTGGTIGFFGAQNMLDLVYRPDNPCSLIRSVLTLLAAMGFTFAFMETCVANLRQKNDPINGATGACAAGFLAGVRSVFLRHCPHAPDTYKVSA